MTLKKTQNTQNTLSKNRCTHWNLNLGFLKAFLHKFLVTSCARRELFSIYLMLTSNSRSDLHILSKDLSNLSPEISFHVWRGMVWRFKFVNGLTRFTHSTALKICFSVQTPQIGILKGEKRKNGGEVTEQQNIQNKKIPEQQKMSACFCSKKCTLMRGCTNERFC